MAELESFHLTPRRLRISNRGAARDPDREPLGGLSRDGGKAQHIDFAIGEPARILRSAWRGSSRLIETGSCEKKLRWPLTARVCVEPP